MRMRLYARVELHATGEITNNRQREDLLLLRARVAALLEQERIQAQLPLPLAEPVSDGEVPASQDVPPWE